MTSPIATSVFMNLSQHDLDRAYDQDVWAANATEVQSRILARSAEIAREMPPVTRRYGPGDKQFVDIFGAAAARDAPVFLMIHGGAWRMAMRETFYGPAPAIVAAGCILAVIGFECLPAVSMIEMTAQIRQALIWIGREIGAFGGNRRHLRLIGHSSGAHLAAIMLTTDWTGLGFDPANLRGATLVSGLYDLHPVMLSSRGRYIELAEDDVAALSPVRRVGGLTCSVRVAWGTEESPEFRRQSQVFADALAGTGRLLRAEIVTGRNHFEMLETLNDANDPVTRAMLADAFP